MNHAFLSLPEVLHILELIESLHSVDSYSAGHSWRVSDYSLIMGEMLGLSEPELFYLFMGAVSHDIGKLKIPPHILQKPGKLTPEERNRVEKHSLFGKGELENNSLIPFIKNGILEHHERIDGSGYPLGLKGTEISLEGKIIAIADVYDALTSIRPYRNPMSHSTAINYLFENAGAHFDLSLVSLFATIPIEKISIIKEKIGDVHPLHLVNEKTTESKIFTAWSKIIEHPEILNKKLINSL
ncbi:MAG: HD-GYP domain-containing protein [Leptospiraceae bacterium]|nr:HD-GYP domain-containing protein [Leptospiraceae bacterium]